VGKNIDIGREPYPPSRVKERMMPAMPAAAGHPDGGELDPDQLARCQAGEPAALRAFVAHYQRPVFALLSRVVGQLPEVEDLAQETFLRAIRALPGFDARGAARLSTWLLTIATRLALDVCRKRARERRSALAADLVSAATPEHEMQRAELRGAIASAIDELPPDQRAAFVLAEFHDFAMADIAAALQISKSTVKTRLFRARAKLSRALADHRGMQNE
jgi:RNA polymerase sigma-70 factor, ECF subfamily